MDNKEIILKRLLENNHITMEEFIILYNEEQNNHIIPKDYNPYPTWQEPHKLYLYNIII